MERVSRCSAGVDSRERNEQGAKHYVTAVVSENESEANEQIFDLTGGYDNKNSITTALAI